MFGYKNCSQLELDSFLQFVHSTRLRVWTLDLLTVTGLLMTVRVCDLKAYNTHTHTSELNAMFKHSKDVKTHRYSFIEDTQTHTRGHAYKHTRTCTLVLNQRHVPPPPSLSLSRTHRDTQRHTNTHALTHTATRTRIHIHTRAHTQMHTNTHAHIHARAHTHTHCPNVNPSVCFRPSCSTCPSTRRTSSPFPSWVPSSS